MSIIMSSEVLPYARQFLEKLDKKFNCQFDREAGKMADWGQGDCVPLQGVARPATYGLLRSKMSLRSQTDGRAPEKNRND